MGIPYLILSENILKKGKYKVWAIALTDYNNDTYDYYFQVRSCK